VPVSTLSAGRLRSLLANPPSDLALDDLLFASKAEVEARDGDDLTLSVTPDRLDLLSEAGLSLHIAGVTGAAVGLLHVPEVRAPPARSVRVDPSVDAVRPYLAAVVVHAPESSEGLDEGTLAEAIRFQELLHATIGRDRRAASLGIYPLERLDFPLRYSLEPLADVRFVPLDGDEEVDAVGFFSDHPMALRYGSMGRVDTRCLTLRDEKGTVLSLPPVLNGRTAGEARVGDRALVLEATGTRERAVQEVIRLLLVVFAARGWSAAPVSIDRGGASASVGTEVYRPRAVSLPSAVLRAVTGDSLAVGEVERRLGQARLSGRPHPGGWVVEVPPWRPDLLAPVDLAEDVVLTAGVRPEDGILLPSRTRGRRLAETRFQRRIRSLLTGLGYAEPHTPLLVSVETAELTGSLDALRLRNPVSAEFSVLRDRLLPSHVDVLRRNTRLAYPQRFAEVGPVIVRSEKAESGGETRYHASGVIAADTAGFADAASWVDYLLRSVDVVAVREPLELTALIPGRSARARVAGESVAEMGEIHPRVLESLGVPVPAAWAEVDLTGLWALVRRHEAH
jgi:phenylalanyl-tRNA synthetase beta chain